jgi:hypothetical protein
MARTAGTDKEDTMKVTEAQAQEAYDTAKTLADAGHDASEAWDRFYALCEQLPTPACMDPDAATRPDAF